MIYFNNDYCEGCHQRILDKLSDTNLVQTPGYGTDDYCRHAAELIRIAPSELPGKTLPEFASTICSLEVAAFDRMQEDVSWFCRKFDYRNYDEPWYNSRDAVERTVNKLRGWCVGTEPNPKD